MAGQFKACAVEGCKRNAHYSANGACGLCNTHYARKRAHGDPNITKNPWGQARAWIEKHATHQGDECLPWPFSKNPAGYGLISFRGAHMNASRAMCIVAHGEPETPGLDAAHSCGKGNQGCVNPRHLRWDTRSGNFSDMVEHGTARRGELNPLAKLTADDIAEIRALRGMISQREIGLRFSIDPSNVSHIQRGKSWGWLK